MGLERCETVRSLSVVIYKHSKKRTLVREDFVVLINYVPIVIFLIATLGSYIRNK